jgi:hypothetical protein
MSYTNVQPAQPAPTRGLQDYPVPFVHVGMGKCASTYLQRLWMHDKAYNWLNPDKLVRAIRTIAEVNSGQTIQFAPPQKVAQRCSVISSEGFSWGWLNDPTKQASIKRLQEASARFIGETGLSGQVLIVVRDPVDLLRAVHEQSIKEGGYAPYPEFLNSQRVLCEGLLDLSFILETFGEFAENVVVLSADELRAAPEVFWTKYASSLGAPKPSQEALKVANAPGPHQNSSLGDRMPILARLNRFAAATTDCYEGLDLCHAVYPQEYGILRPLIGYNRQWLYRRLVEFASDEELHSLVELLAPGDDDLQGGVFVDQALYDWIETRFLQPLEGLSTIPEELLSQYRQSLAAALNP